MHDRKAIPLKEGHTRWGYGFRENAIRLGQTAEELVGYAFPLMVWQDGDSEDEESPAIRAEEVDHIRFLEVRIIGKTRIDWQIRDEPYRFMQDKALMANNEVQIF